MRQRPSREPGQARPEPAPPARPAARFAARFAARLAGVLATIALTLGAAVLFAGLALAFRLTLGPIDITLLVGNFAARAKAPVAISLRHASIAWDGWRHPGAPIVIALDGVRLASRAGAPLDVLDRASISLSAAALLRGVFAPVSLAAADGRLRLTRRPDGVLELAPGLPLGGNEQLAGAKPQPDFFRALTEVRLSRLSIDLDDRMTGETLRLTGLDLDAGRPGPKGHAHATLALGAASTTLSAAVSDNVMTLETGALDANRLSAFVPAFAKVSAPIALSVRAPLGPGHAPITADLSVGAGALDGVPIRTATVHLTLNRDHALSGHAALALHAVLAQNGPTLDVSGTLAGDAAKGGHLTGALAIRSTPVPIPPIGTWWPPDVAKGGRQWVLANLTTGTAGNLDLHIGLASTDGAAGLAASNVGGGFDGTGLTLHWLRPIAPITDAAARLELNGADSLTVALSAGHQGALDVAGTTMRIGGLNSKDQPGDINAHVSGPLASVLSLLAAPRLRLLSKHPLPLKDPTGAVDAKLHVALPLDDRVTMDQITIGAHVALARVHLGDVALGHALDDGRFILDADTAGLSMHGQATFARVPLTLAVAMDFRAGPPSQVLERVQASTRAGAGAIASISAGAGRILGGDVSLSADYSARRDDTATLALDADLTDASVTTPLGWGKHAGPPARLEAALVFANGGLEAIDRFAATGPALDIASHGIAGGLAFDRLDVGRTRAAGRLLFPSKGTPFRLTLSGASLDLSAQFDPSPKPDTHTPRPAKARAPAKSPGPAQGPRWSADLAFDRVTLAHRIQIGGVRAEIVGAGGHIASAHASATGPVPMTGRLAARPEGGRALDVSTDDAGALLEAFDLTDRIRDGRMSVAATLAGDAPDDGITGTLHLDRFTLLRVPALVRLLRDLTVYGLADPARSPNLSVSRVTVPFRWRDGTLALDHASAWQPALGLTARGAIDTDDDRLNINGTIVPAYIVNTLPGRIPLVGRLFSPERGGGLLAATFTLRGPSGDPAVSVNPLAALLPGMLRDLLPH